MAKYTYRILTQHSFSFGPFDLGLTEPGVNLIGAYVESGDREHTGAGAYVYLIFFAFRLRLYGLLKAKKFFEATGVGLAATAVLHPRKFGFTYGQTLLTLFYGWQDHMRFDGCYWVWQLPWLAWRLVAHRVYDINGELFQENREPIFRIDIGNRLSPPVCKFDIRDYDDTYVEATTYIEEFEHSRGEGWFKFIGLLTPNDVRRSLRIKFDKEVGPEKHSWKGGILGCGIDMRKGELHTEAFKRWCSTTHKSKNGNFRVQYLRKC